MARLGLHRLTKRRRGLVVLAVGAIDKPEPVRHLAVVRVGFEGGLQHAHGVGDVALGGVDLADANGQRRCCADRIRPRARSARALRRGRRESRRNTRSRIRRELRPCRSSAGVKADGRISGGAGAVRPVSPRDPSRSRQCTTPPPAQPRRPRALAFGRNIDPV